MNKRKHTHSGTVVSMLCKLCGDTGFCELKGKKVPCACVLMGRVRVFLKKLVPVEPAHELVSSLDGIDSTKNILLLLPSSFQIKKLKWIFGYLLLTKGFRRSYECLNVYTLLEITLGHLEGTQSVLNFNHDVLMLYYGFCEFTNKRQGDIILQTLEARDVKGLASWLAIRGQPDFIAQLQSYTADKNYQVVDLGQKSNKKRKKVI